MKYSITPAILALTLLAACGQKDPQAELAALKKEQAENQAKIAALEAKTTPKAAAGATQVVPVSVLNLKPTDFKSFLEVQGRVDFDQNSTVSARSGGSLTSLRVRRGDRVRKGQILATIDAGVLEANIAELRTRLDLARVVYEKQKRLWDQQIGTEIQFLQAKNNYEALQRSLSTLGRQRELFNVTAPFAGTADEVIPKLGEVVAPGTPVVRLVSSSGGKILADVSESYSGSIKAGDKAVVTIPDMGNQEFPATVRVVSSSINPTSRTFTTELRLDGKSDLQLRPNMVATVRILNYNRPNATVVPVDLVQRDEQNSYVYVVEQKGNQPVARKRVIQTGATYNGQVEVTSGLSANDKVISAGYQNINEGQVVSL